MLTENQKCILLTGKTLRGKDASKRRSNVLSKARKKANSELKRIPQSLEDVDFLLKLSAPSNRKIDPLTKKPKTIDPKIDPELLLNLIDSYLKQAMTTRQEREVQRLPQRLGKLPPGICRSHAPSGTKWIQFLGPLNDRGNGPLKKEIGPKIDFAYRLLERLHQSVVEMQIPYDALEKKLLASYNPRSLIIIESSDNLNLSLTPSLHQFVESYVKEKIDIELSSLADNDYVKNKIGNLSRLLDYGKVWSEQGEIERTEHRCKPANVILGRY